LTHSRINIAPQLGEGVYLIKDVAKILRLDYQKAYRWIVGYWGALEGSLEENISYTFGTVGNRAINFYSLIEFYTFFKLRDAGVSAHYIKKIHRELSQQYNTPYPFAKVRDFRVEPRKNKHGIVTKKFVYYYDKNLIKLDGKQQAIFDGFIDNFLQKIEFDDNNLAARFYPLNNSKNVVVDPNHQFGQPVVTGTNVKTSTIATHFRGGDDIELISKIYNLSERQVQDAISFDLDIAA
jgi:uncharacterized protein (DUF433 family)